MIQGIEHDDGGPVEHLVEDVDPGTPMADVSLADLEEGPGPDCEISNV